MLSNAQQIAAVLSKFQQCSAMINNPQQCQQSLAMLSNIALAGVPKITKYDTSEQLETPKNR